LADANVQISSFEDFAEERFAPSKNVVEESEDPGLLKFW
jgi:hypothetical protein